MKGFPVYHLNHDIQNIIEIMVFYYRMKNTNNEYRRVFYFFDTIYDGSCPNPHGRCVTKYRNAQIHWMDGKYHRKNGPAVEWASGTKWWCLNNQLHREDGPAVENANGDKAWYYMGQLHRLDGPAIEYADDDDRPIEYVDGTKEWYVNGKRKSE